MKLGGTKLYIIYHFTATHPTPVNILGCAPQAETLAPLVSQYNHLAFVLKSSSLISDRGGWRLETREMGALFPHQAKGLNRTALLEMACHPWMQDLRDNGGTMQAGLALWQRWKMNESSEGI